MMWQKVSAFEKMSNWDNTTGMKNYQLQLYLQLSNALE